MDNAFMVFGWGSPIGLGIFLACLGAMIYLLSHAKDDKKDDKE